MQSIAQFDAERPAGPWSFAGPEHARGIPLQVEAGGATARGQGVRPPQQQPEGSDLLSCIRASLLGQANLRGHDR